MRAPVLRVHALNLPDVDERVGDGEAADQEPLGEAAADAQVGQPLLDIDRERADGYREMEKRRRERTMQLLQSPNILDDLKIVHACLLPQRTLMDTCIKAEMLEWEFERLQTLHESQQCVSRLGDLHRDGGLLDKMLAQCMDIVSGADGQAVANVAFTQDQENAKKIFVCTLRSAGIIHEKCISAGRTFPLKLLLLLSEPDGPEQLLLEQRCVMDSFTQAFVGRFSAPALLRSPACEAIVHCLKERGLVLPLPPPPKSKTLATSSLVFLLQDGPQHASNSFSSRAWKNIMQIRIPEEPVELVEVGLACWS